MQHLPYPCVCVCERLKEWALLGIWSGLWSQVLSNLCCSSKLIFHLLDNGLTLSNHSLAKMYDEQVDYLPNLWKGINIWTNLVPTFTHPPSLMAKSIRAPSMVVHKESSTTFPMQHSLQTNSKVHNHYSEFNTRENTFSHYSPHSLVSHFSPWFPSSASLSSTWSVLDFIDFGLLPNLANFQRWPSPTYYVSFPSFIFLNYFLTPCA